jgi:hypothetical protein
LVESRRSPGRRVTSVVLLLILRWGCPSDRLEEPFAVEPMDPFEGGEFDGLEAAPGAAPTDDLGLVQAVDRLREGVVVSVADAADGAGDVRCLPCQSVARRASPPSSWSRRPVRAGACAGV